MLEENNPIKYDYHEFNDNSNAFDFAEAMKNKELSNLLQQYEQFKNTKCNWLTMTLLNAFY